MESCLLRDDLKPMMNNRMLFAQAPVQNPQNNSKLPIKISSVVLDGLEMKLAAHSSGFGSRYD
jgi:hypothetical protein